MNLLYLMVHDIGESGGIYISTVGIMSGRQIRTSCKFCIGTKLALRMSDIIVINGQCRGPTDYEKYNILQEAEFRERKDEVSSEQCTRLYRLILMSKEMQDCEMSLKSTMSFAQIDKARAILVNVRSVLIDERFRRRDTPDIDSKSLQMMIDQLREALSHLKLISLHSDAMIEKLCSSAEASARSRSKIGAVSRWLSSTINAKSISPISPSSPKPVMLCPRTIRYCESIGSPTSPASRRSSGSLDSSGPPSPLMTTQMMSSII